MDSPTMDRQPIDRQYVQRNHLVERYVRKELSAEETAEFEQFFLTDQQTQQELEAELLLCDGLAKVSTERSAPIPSHTNTATLVAANSPNMGWWLGASVAALAMLVIGNLAGNRSAEMIGVSQGLFFDGALRGDSEQRSIGTLCAGQASTISLRTPGAGPYSMTLSNDGEAYYRVADQTVAKHSTTNELQLFLSAKSLPTGPSRFELIEQSTGETIVEASFDVDPDC